MSYEHVRPDGAHRWARPMEPRDPHEHHRAATPLELFFDLVFVVAVAQAARGLHHALAEGAIAAPVAKYAFVFFAIWWAWMGFSWFASAYDTEDIAYRLVIFVQITGALILAAGIPRAFDELNFTVAVVGYVVMRSAQVAHWFRVAARAQPGPRAAALRYVKGITACQVGWVLRLAVPGAWGVAVFVVLAAAELLVPVWAERAAPTVWHSGHVVERYGLFTIIVLGESVLAGTLAIQTVVEGGLDAELVGLIVGGLLIVFTMWWLYFDYQVPHVLTTNRPAFIWGYGHVFVFAAVGGDRSGPRRGDRPGVGALGSERRAGGRRRRRPGRRLPARAMGTPCRAPRRSGSFATCHAGLAGLVLVAAALPHPVLLVGLLVAGMMAYKLVRRVRDVGRQA